VRELSDARSAFASVKVGHGSETGIIAVTLSCEKDPQLAELLVRKMILENTRLAQILGPPPAWHIFACCRMLRNVFIERNAWQLDRLANVVNACGE
jgi:hypothetical protein